MEDIKLMQKMRGRSNGISAQALATTKEVVEKKTVEVRHYAGMYVMGFNTLRPKRMSDTFSDHIFESIFMNGSHYIF